LAEARKAGQVLIGYCDTTLSDARAIITGVQSKVHKWESMSDADAIEWVVDFARRKQYREIYISRLPSGIQEKILRVGVEAFNEMLTDIKILHVHLDYKSWTFDECKTEALKYTTKKEWRDKHPQSYQAAQKKGWMKECVKHFIVLRRNWTLEECKIEALKYTCAGDWSKYGKGSYLAASKNGWRKECSKHFISSRKPRGYWTLERCKEDALLYKNWTEWKNSGSGGAYAAAVYGWKKECSQHFIVKNKPKGYWTKELCQIEADKYTRRIDWQRGHPASWAGATNLGCIDECTKNYPFHQKIWDYDRCKADAAKYQTVKDWCRKQGKASPQSYVAARDKNWIERIILELGMIDNRKHPGWTKELCKIEADKYTNKRDWIKNSPSSYNMARKNKWLEELCKHMTILNFVYTEEALIKDAQRFTTYNEWWKNNPSATTVAKRNGVFMKCIEHFTDKSKIRSKYKTA
jgi:hypothetical protein